ncbi:NapC/NirT family cytochrome c [Skermanella mucosa]|uniref:NapC/NirT family cytochrome c n=1 Tax=Skermanella mucosa TaxID=1789672 RepID=UPI00192CC435|nr:NapC/NirT family cytochrome c [Skermanella mucosa]UEM20520.1 NapC/NirT family cytochrome c [Skermanella mucosa]
MDRQRFGVSGIIAAAAVGGIVAGVIGWGGFNTVMEATNSMEFCISCHEMRDTVYTEYTQTIHYRNGSGVRAVCADCHVPRDWTHKVARKLAATNEIYHWLAGSIDTREKFEARRHELARHEWDRMRASDSRECRNCHSFEAMDPHRQSAKAAKAMGEAAMGNAAKTAKTCIDCHKGIAHAFPDVTAGHRRTFAELSAEAAALALKPGQKAYALTTLPLRVERPEADAPADGELAAATPVRVLAVADGLVQVEVLGWRRGNAAETLYAEAGRRITLARLGNAASAGAEALRTVTDPDTGRDWTEVRLAVWTRADGYVPALGSLWTQAARVYDANCTLCHAAYPPSAYTANDWIGNINAMRRLTKLDDEEIRLLQTYLQLHAKDMAAPPR